MAVKPVPEGYHTATPYLVIDGAARAIEFYKKAFGAVEKLRMPDAKTNRIGHAEILIGDSHIMMADEYPNMGYKGPHSLGGTPVSILLYVPDVDKTVETAVALGAKIEKPVQNQFYGDRMGSIEDPFGHKWSIATHIEDVSPEEMQRRMAAMS